MERPLTVPEGAFYNEEDKEWLLGNTDENGQRTGLWQIWHTTGYRWVTIDYRHGIPPYPVQRFHPDGTVSQEGEWYGGNKYIGPLRLIKSDNTTPEHFPPNNGDNVWIAEFDYVDEYIYNAQRYFDKHNNPVSSDGDPLPERPASVPARAHFVRQPYSATNWIMGTVNTTTGKYIHEYAEWDLNGTLLVQRVYSTDGRVLEEYKYEDGVLISSNVYDKEEPGNHVTCYYYNGTSTPVVKNRIDNRNKNKDVTHTYFDKTGNLLYSARREELSPTHKRRYFNGELVCEGYLGADNNSFPESAVYYAAGGATLIDFTNNNDGTGTWRLYDATRQVLRQLTVAEDDDDHFRLVRWDPFLPSWGSYDAKFIRTDWESIIFLFNKYYTELYAAEKIQTLAIPAYLQAELDTVDWPTIGTYHSGGGAELPIAINGMLSDDEAIADIAGKMLWAEIQQQDNVYAATYKVTAILARMLPHYQHLPVVQNRLIKFLYNIFGLNYINEQGDLYTEMTEAIAPFESMLLQWTGNDDIALSQMAQYILIYVGKDATEQFLLQQWQNTANSSTVRGYAIYSLTDFYATRNQHTKLLTTYATAFTTETVPFVRFVIAAQLVLLTGEDAQDAWLSALLQALADQEALNDEYGNMVPFIGNIDEIDEYILLVLRKSRPDVLEKNIALLINDLHGMHSQEQVSHLRIIFAVLFSDEDALEEITPIRKEALLAAADLIAKDPGYINLLEVCKEFGLPHEAYALKQLASA